MTGARNKYEIQFRKREKWTISGQWPRKTARAALKELRATHPESEWRLVWNGLVIDPPGRPIDTLPMLRINVGNAEE